ncbi:TIGR03089 family protein [Actinomycetaceae bacterium MB13-C1-2]|nr:TIGR03089 family protein [Actinomycetaceae bacterium MB13-C1-2]
MEQLNATGLTKRITNVSEPVLTWFAPAGRERIELSGPVARRWIAKTDNFMASEFPYGGEHFCALLPAHWRTPFWLLVPWMRGMRLEPPRTATDVDLVVSDDSAFLESIADQGGPDALVAQNLHSLALAWSGELPGTMLDGIADVMTYGDWVEDPAEAEPGVQLVSESIEWVPPKLWTKPEEQGLPIETLGSLDYVGPLFAADRGKGSTSAKAGETSSQESLARASLRQDSLTDSVPRRNAHADSSTRGDSLGAAEPSLSASSLDLEGARILVHTLNPVLFSAQIAGFWMAGARVIWAPGHTVSQELLDRERPDYVLPDGGAHS